MRKGLVVVALIVALAVPVGAQSVSFLVNLMKAVVEEYGIERVIGVLEDLGYIGDGEVAVQEPSELAADLTVNHDIWDLPEDELVDVLISQMNDPGNEDCWTYVNLGTSEYSSAPDRMKYRAKFIDICIRE